MPPDQAPVLVIDRLTVSFPGHNTITDVVKNLDLVVQRGEVLAVVGESGSGKSMTAWSVLDLLPARARRRGTIRVCGHDIGVMSPSALRALRGATAAMVFQDPSLALNPVVTVGTQLVDTLRAHRAISRKDARAKAAELLELVGIPSSWERLDYYPHQLSGGQRQRVVIALALSCDPDLLVADEPTTALDVTVQAEILALLRDLRDKLGMGILLITHNMGVVADLADRVAAM